jgi:hypothetical protein
MSSGPSFHDNQPITWWKRLPIYAATIVTGVLVVGMIVSVIFATAGLPLGLFTFSAPAFSRGALWQIFTFPFITLPSFFTLLGIACFFSWGVEVEKYLGRVRFFQLIGALIFVEAAVCLAWWWIFRVPAVTAGNYHLTAALLIAFATLYPNIEYLFGWVPLKWFAFASIVLGSLMALPNHQWPELTMLWATCAVAFGFVRWVQHGGEINLRFRFNISRRRPKLRVLRDPDESSGHEEESEATSEVDALLDKIAKSGLGSLTAKERARLEQAREELMKRESPRR